MRRQVKLLVAGHMRTFFTGDFAEIPNSDLWREIARSITTTGRKVTARHVRAHTDRQDSDSLNNNTVDRLAKHALGFPDINPPAFSVDPSPIPWFGVSDAVPTTEEVQRALSRLRSSSAPGPERIHAKWIKKSVQLQELLVKLVVTCWQKRRVPEAWKQAIMVAIPDE